MNKPQKPDVFFLVVYIVAPVAFSMMTIGQLMPVIATVASVIWTIILLTVYYWTYSNWRKLDAQYEKRMAEIAKNMKDLRATAYGRFGHFGGLALPQGLSCGVYYTSYGIEILTGNQHIKIAKSKIVDINIKTDTDIQKHLVSSPDGAVFGSWSFGKLSLGGAKIGSSIKEGQTQTTSHYLIIFYKKTKSAKNNDFVIFDVTNNLDANAFVAEFYKSKPSKAVTEL